MNKKKTDILFFGCWNRGFCSDSNIQTLDQYTGINEDTEINRGIELTQTMKILKELVSEIKNDKKSKCLIIVAGDNYYPLKTQKDGKKQKQIITKSLLSGFNCLKNAVSNNETLVLLGNHDIEYIDGCDILKIQKQFVNNTRNLKLFDFDTFDILKHIHEHTIIIMLDSTIFDDIGEDTFECYMELKGSDSTRLIENEDTTTESLNKNKNIQSYEFNKLKEKIKSIKKRLDNPDDPISISKIKNIVFMSHHPIYGLKESIKIDVDSGKTKTKIKPDVIPKFVDFLYKEFIDFYKDRELKYYHLCADVHNYNYMLLTFPNNIQVHQYIVGTGGAEKDIYTDFTYNSESINQKKNDTITGNSIIDNQPFNLDIEYNIQDYTHDNGILNVTILSDNSDISFKFIKNVKTISKKLSFSHISQQLKRVKQLRQLRRTRKLQILKRSNRSRSLQNSQKSLRLQGSRKSTRIIPIIRSRSLRTIPKQINAKQIQNNILLSNSI